MRKQLYYTAIFIAFVQSMLAFASRFAGGNWEFFLGMAIFWALLAIALRVESHD